MERKNEDWTDIARTGTFTAGNGQTVTLTGEDLDRIVTGFDERERRVPLVFGHPKTSAPAYGWVESFRRMGDVLQARFKQVHEDVKTLVRNGHFKNISISLSADNYYSLKHTYEGSMFWRQYIPFGSNMRFALFTEAELVFGGSQAKYLAHVPVKGTYETSFSTSLNIAPGIAAFITNDVAIELNVGMMGVTFKTVRQTHNQVETGKRNESLMNFKINLLSIGLGLAVYL